MSHAVLRPRPSIGWIGALLLASAVSAGCGAEGTEQGGPSGAICSATSNLSFENFGQPFMQAYCTRYHDSALAGSARNGAPTGHDFDTLERLKRTPVQHIDEQAAAGSLHVNTAMPPDAPRPTEAERRRLGEWLACGMP